MGSLTLSKIDEYSLRIPVAPQFGGDRFIPMRSAGDENAQQLQYQQKSQIQQIQQNQNKYKGEKIVYDIEHDLVTIPGSKNKRSTIVLDGIQSETKIRLKS